MGKKKMINDFKQKRGKFNLGIKSIQALKLTLIIRPKLPLCINAITFGEHE